MDPETKKVTVSCDVGFDEVPSYKFDANKGQGTANLYFFFVEMLHPIMGEQYFFI